MKKNNGDFGLQKAFRLLKLLENTQGLEQSNDIHYITCYLYIINKVPKENAKKGKIYAQHLNINLTEHMLI